jgi:hypothetical protein
MERRERAARASGNPREMNRSLRRVNAIQNQIRKKDCSDEHKTYLPQDEVEWA